MIDLLKIEELLDLEDIEKLEMKYEKEFGYEPFNISTWNPSQEFIKNHVLTNFNLNLDIDNSSYIKYLYSYELEKQSLNLLKLKLANTTEIECILTNTGTATIDLVVSVLKQLNIKKILIISPTYFSVFYNCMQKNIDIIELHIKRIDGQYFLPKEEILCNLRFVDALWITNPIYNTSVYYTDEDIEFLRKNILPHKMIICDDCFSINGKGLINKFGISKNYIGIHDPMKQILVNGLKFSCVFFEDKYQQLFEQWSDIICGSLTYSTVQALAFFNSEFFEKISNEIQLKNRMTHKRLKSILKDYPNVSTDSDVLGHMQVCYFPDVPYNYFKDTSKLKKLIWSTGGSVIPGDRFHFSPKDNFNFRINLSRECVEFWDALDSILGYLASLTSK